MMRTHAKVARAGGLALALTVLFAPAGGAAVSEQEAAQLGKTLTPVGAEKAANKDGTIPEWTGGVTTMPAGGRPGQKRIDPFAADKPLFAIDATNVDKYKDKLSDGQVALIKQLKGYRMDVYPTRRSCGFPDFVYERTKTDAREAKLAANGWGLEKGIGAAVLFPIPKTGAEAVWNHKLRYMGEGRIEYYATIFSNKGGDFTPLVQDQWTIVPFHSPKNKGVEDVAGVEMKLHESAVVSPPAHAGEIILAHWFFNEASDAWLYFPGQRRVRRAPTFNYDNPVPGYENLETVDQYPMYAGAMDRYDWKLVGKQEMYIPYNNFKLDRQEPQVQGHLPRRLRQSRPGPLRAAPRVEGRGDGQAGDAPPVRQARVLPRRGQLGDHGRRPVRRAGQALARAGIERLPRLRDSGLRRPGVHVLRPHGRPLHRRERDAGAARNGLAGGARGPHRSEEVQPRRVASCGRALTL